MTATDGDTNGDGAPPAPAAKTSRLKDVTDRHPLFVAFGVLLTGIAIGAIPLPILEASHDDEISSKDAEIERLETELGSITRAVGGETEPFDVERILVDPAEARSIPASHTPIDQAGLFVPGGVLDEWNYSPMTELEHIADISGLTREEVEEIFGDPRALDLELHRWELPGRHVIDDASAALDAFTFVVVQRVPVEDLIERLSLATAADTESREAIEALIREDPSGAMLQLQLATALGSAGPHLTPILQTVDRAGAAAYVQLSLLYRDVTVDERPAATYLLVQELIILDVGSDLVMIRTSVPTPDQRSSDFDEVTSLLTSLRIVR